MSPEPDLDVAASEGSTSPPPVSSSPPVAVSSSAENRKNSIEALRTRAKEHLADQNRDLLSIPSSGKATTVTS